MDAFDTLYDIPPPGPPPTSRDAQSTGGLSGPAMDWVSQPMVLPGTDNRLPARRQPVLGAVPQQTPSGTYGNSSAPKVALGLRSPFQRLATPPNPRQLHRADGPPAFKVHESWPHNKLAEECVRLRQEMDWVKTELEKHKRKNDWMESELTKHGEKSDVATEYLSSMSAWMTQSKHHLDRCMAQIRDAIAGVTIGGMGGYEGQQEAEDSLQALA